MDNSSVMYATILTGPPQPLHTSGAAWYTLLMSRAQLGGQRLFIGAAELAENCPKDTRRSGRGRSESVDGLGWITHAFCMAAHAAMTFR